MRMTRRLIAALPVALVPAGARAFRLEAADPATAAAYGTGCAATELHEALRAELAKALEGRPVPTALAPQLAALTRCPLCGCAVAGAPDHAEAPPPPG